MSAHLSDDTLERLAMGELPAAARADAAAHAARCPACAALCRGVLAVEDEARGRGLDGVPAPRPARARRAALAAAAVAVAAAAAVILWLAVRDDGAARTPALRGDAPAVIEVLAPTGAVTPPVELAWRPVAGAARYRVEVFTVDGRPVWSREVAAPRVAWPADVPAPAPGAELRWRVEARDGDAVRAASPVKPLRIAP